MNRERGWRNEPAARARDDQFAIEQARVTGLGNRDVAVVVRVPSVVLR